MATTHTLVLGATGKIGRRVANRLKARGLPVRLGSRSAELPFVWEDRNTWTPALRGASAAFVTYFPDLAVPGAADTVGAFADLAVKTGVRRVVLLSGRGEEGALLGERAVQNSGADWTIVRSAWFNQNFNEGFFVDQVVSGEVALPVGDVREPFVDADDIAEVAVAALTDDRHVGQLYELTGPRLITFPEAIREIAEAVGREIRYVQISPEQYASLLAEQKFTAEIISLMDYVFGTVLDGRNAHLADGVERALGRRPRDFAEYVRGTAASGAWSSAHQPRALA
jgi:uncharacterized protein YbjT (DUF2867 family)